MSAVGTGSGERVRAGRRVLTVHRPDKVLYPDDGLTKGEVVGYYRDIAPHMVPHLRDRPLMLEREPEGVGEQPHFMQKNAGAHYPEWVRRAPMPKEGGGTVDHPVCDDAATLVFLADQAVLTFHRWLSTVGNPRHPDLLVFDLDPPGDDFAAVREAALRFRELLAEVELDPLLMTTGSRGLHLVVRLDGRAGHDTVRAFAQDAAALLAARHPDRLTTAVRKDRRGDRLFLDSGRNAYAQTAVAPWSLRSRPGAPVAAPLTWEQLDDPELDARTFSLRDPDGVHAQAASRPWARPPRPRGIAAAARRLEKLRGST
ncbi:non-homologous end-joining DNA ligase [Streptomyces koyangensis]|uniref:non-homologous end-joining DNA ligase n=1 Tax=Streptomyces koyangensis TaxID=188770 RepID=UPI003C2B83E6